MTMRSRLERLRRLEDEADRRSPPRDSQLQKYLSCLGVAELGRLAVAYPAGMNRDEAAAADAVTLLELAIERHEKGWTQADSDGLRAQEWDKTRALWQFTGALQRRHVGFYPDSSRFDLLDVTETEIKQLAEVTETAIHVTDLEAVVEIVGRLRLDGHAVDMAIFEALVLRGEIAVRPPEPDWRYFQPRGDNCRRSCH